LTVKCINFITDDPVLVKTLAKFFIFITWHKNSSGALMKYICQDLVFIFQVCRDGETDSSNLNEQVFNCLTYDNINLLMSAIFDELSNIIDLCDWFISFKTDHDSMIHFYKQFNTLLESIKCLLAIDLETNSPQESVLRLLTRFYSFMITLCKSIGNREIRPDEEILFKAIIDYTALKFQKPLNQFIKLIQNAKSSIGKEKSDKSEKNGADEKSKKAKDDGQSKANKLIKCGKMIPNLVYLVGQYEHQLKLLNKHFENRVKFCFKNY
jgi:hypothetical protein